MSKETIKMNSIRVTRIGIKAVLQLRELSARMNRQVINSNWDKEDDDVARKALYKAHRGLAKDRVVINECQRQLRALKRELRKLNHQHDIHINALALAREASMVERTTLLE